MERFIEEIRIDSDAMIVIDGATCFNFTIDGLVVVYDDFHFILNFHKHIHVRMKRAFDAIPDRLQIFSFAARNFFRLASDPPIPEITTAYLNNVFEEIYQLAFEHGQQPAWQFLSEVSALIIRVKVYWLKLYMRQNPRQLMVMKSEILMAINSFSFSPFVRFVRRFKKSLVKAFIFFKNRVNQNEPETIPVHNLTLYPLEGLLEGFKLVRMHSQPLTQATATDNLQFLSRGAVLIFENSSCLNDV